MIKEETKKILKRIKVHYNEFSVDSEKVDEWHNYLKDYLYEDVNKKLDEHLNNEQYGKEIPKVAFLVKYLTKEKDKGKVEDFKIQCYICGNYFKNSEYQEHFKRCSSINYMNNQRYNYFGLLFSLQEKKKLYEMDEESFRKKYREMLEVIKNNTKDLYEKERVIALLENRPFTIQMDLIKDTIRNDT